MIAAMSQNLKLRKFIVLSMFFERNLHHNGKDTIKNKKIRHCNKPQPHK